MVALIPQQRVYPQGACDDRVDSLRGWQVQHGPQRFAGAVQLTTTRACEREIGSGEGLVDIRLFSLLGVFVRVHGLQSLTLGDFFLTGNQIVASAA